MEKQDYLVSDNYGFWWLVTATSVEAIRQAFAVTKKTLMTCCLIDYTTQDGRQVAGHLRDTGYTFRCK